MDTKTRQSRQDLARDLRRDAQCAERDGEDDRAGRIKAAASLIEVDFTFSETELSDRERDTLAWLLNELESASCLTPGVIYSEHVSPNEISLTVRLPETFSLSPEVCARESKVIESYVQLAIRTMLIQSGHYGLPMPVSLIPEHPSDEAAMRLIRQAAAQVKTVNSVGAEGSEPSLARAC